MYTSDTHVPPIVNFTVVQHPQYQISKSLLFLTHWHDLVIADHIRWESYVWKGTYSVKFLIFGKQRSVFIK